MSNPAILRANQVHPGRKCSRCLLCGQPSARYSHPVHWKAEQRNFLHQWVTTATNSDCICRTCSDDLKRNIGNTNYIPRWVGKRQSGVSAVKYNIKGCHQPYQGIKYCSLGTTGQLIELLYCEVGDLVPDKGILLCTIHYNEFFRALNPQTCASCGNKVREIRHPPNPDLINSILEAHTDLQRQIE